MTAKVGDLLLYGGKTHEVEAIPSDGKVTIHDVENTNDWKVVNVTECEAVPVAQASDGGSEQETSETATREAKSEASEAAQAQPRKRKSRG